MKKVFFTLIFYVFIGCGEVFAEDSLAKYKEECLSFISEPKVEVTSAYGKLRYDYGKDEEFLRQETAKRFEEMGEEFSESFAPVGLTKVRNAFDFSVIVGQIDVSNGYTCFYPEQIKVHLGYYTPMIYILNSLKEGSCLYDMALRHEKTHLQIYIEALDYFLPQLKKFATQLFLQVGVKIVKRGDAGKAVAQELNDMYLDVMQAKVNGWRKEVEKEQMKLDTVEQYIIENRLCEEIEREDEVF